MAIFIINPYRFLSPVFPNIASEGEEAIAAGSGTTAVFDLPAGIVAGDLIVAFACTANDGEITGATGFTQFFNTGTDAVDFVGFYKTAAGGETTISVTRSADRRCSCRSFRISTGTWQGTPEAAVTGGSKDPPSLSPSWGTTSKTLWIAGVGNTNDDECTSGPAGFSTKDSVITGGAADGNQTATAWLQDFVATKDPGAFTIPVTENLSAVATVAIRGL